MIRTDVVASEVVKVTKEQLVYVCDQCGAEWEIGRHDPDLTINRLHPPRSWWRLAPADSTILWEDRRSRHFCSDACLLNFATGRAGDR